MRRVGEWSNISIITFVTYDLCSAMCCNRVGVKAANAAKMKIVAVPSRRESDCHELANVVLHSLLEFQPEQWGLPPFDDCNALINSYVC